MVVLRRALLQALLSLIPLAIIAIIVLRATGSSIVVGPHGLALLKMRQAVTASNEQTVSAYTLFNMGGVDSHLARSLYSGRYPQMTALISGLNISHIRDSFTSSTVAQPEFKLLYQQYGIDAILSTLPTQNSSEWAQFAGAMGGALNGIEGVNEPNNGVSNWNPSSTRTLQKAIWQATHGGQPALAGVHVINSSVLNCDGNATYGDQSAYTDFANNHKYWPGVNPNNIGYGSSTCGSAAVYGSLEYNILSVQQSAHRPVYVTETGFCTAPIHRCVPQSVAATYEPEIFLAYFGYHNSYGMVAPRVYLYEIVSEGNDATGNSLGLTDSNFVPKPMYYAVSGMFARLKDKPGGFGQINYSLGGDTANLRVIPLAYSNGTHGMILWQDVQIWDQNGNATAQGSPINVPADHTTVTINGQAIGSVTASTYGADGHWIDTPMSGAQPMNVTVGNNMVLLHWSGGAPPTPTPAPSASPMPSAPPLPTPSPLVTPSPVVTPSPGSTGTPSPLPSASSRPSPLPSGTPIAATLDINAGGHDAGTFLSDRDYQGGNQASYYRSGIDTSLVTSPAPQAVYQTGRTGESFQYAIPGLTPNASYTVRLHFAENHWTKPGQRVFDVTMSGTSQTLSKFDILAITVQPHKAFAVDFPGVLADVSGRINLTFSASVNQALISGIEINAKATTVRNVL